MSELLTNPKRQTHKYHVSVSRLKPARGLCVMKSTIDGLGCFVTVPFPKGSVIARYAGERINHREAMRRMRVPGRIRITQLDCDCYIDGSIGGNGTQYINHSCEPNADAVNIDGIIIIIPLQDIAPGQEITIDYLNSFDEDRTVCQCRSASCKERPAGEWLKKGRGLSCPKETALQNREQ